MIENDKEDLAKKEQREEDEKIEQGFNQMETIYKSRCIQPPAGKNVTVTEIDDEE